MSTRRLVELAVTLFALTVSHTLHASEGDRARQLFLEGRQALERGDAATACAKLDESLALETRPNTHFNLGRCHREQGHLLAALHHWRAGRKLISASDERAAAADRQIDSIDRQIPRLTVRLRAALGPRDRIHLNGRRLTQLGAPQPLDPGGHEVSWHRGGSVLATESLALRRGQQRELWLDSGPSSSRRGPPSRPTAAPAPASRSSLSKSSVHPRRIAGYSALGVGAAGVVVAAATGGAVLHSRRVVEDHCDADRRCDATGAAAARRGEALLIPNAVAWGAAAAGGVVGTVLVLTAPEREAVELGAKLGPTGGAVVGRF
jgi:hypothetical protein